MKIDKHIPKVSEIVEDKSLEETDPYTYYNRYSGYTSSILNSFNTLLDGSWETWESDC